MILSLWASRTRPGPTGPKPGADLAEAAIIAAIQAPAIEELEQVGIQARSLQIEMIHSWNGFYMFLPHKNGEIGDGLWHCFTNIRSVGQNLWIIPYWGWLDIDFPADGTW